MTPPTGKVYLIGAGPGDPGLITVKGREALERCDVVVYDRLAHPSLLDYAPASAERVFAGKARGQQELTQDGINALLVERARAGLRVARLKGGDPFVFGRGGEEALALARCGIPFEVVPGVSSAIAAPAYAGIPVTHRGIATGFTVVSGSEDPSKPESSVRWEELARSLASHGGTLMTLMGWASIEKILDALQRAGLSADTPVALVQWGTWNRQRTVTGTLATAAGKGRAAGLAAPVVAVIGEVVKLREELAWFDKRPLFGKRVLVTRSRTQASRMCQLLEDAGAIPVELPAIAIAPPEDFAPLEAAVSRLSSYGWVIFASVNAVDAVFERLEAQDRDARAFGTARSRGHRPGHCRRAGATRHPARLHAVALRIVGCVGRAGGLRVGGRIRPAARRRHWPRRIGRGAVTTRRKNRAGDRLSHCHTARRGAASAGRLRRGHRHRNLHQLVHRPQPVVAAGRPSLPP